MSRRICPRCGSRETAHILWETPSSSKGFEEKIKNKEIVLGDYDTSENKPTYHCNTCESDFGKSTSFEELTTVSVHFSIGGFFGGHHNVTVSRGISGAEIEYVPPFDLIDPLYEIPNLIEPFYDIPCKPNDEWAHFVKDLYRCYVTDWESRYDSDALDGTQWGLEIRFEDDSVLDRSGSNAYPPHWKKLLSVFQKYVSKGIK